MLRTFHDIAHERSPNACRVHELTYKRLRTDYLESEPLVNSDAQYVILEPEYMLYGIKVIVDNEVPYGIFKWE